MLTAYKGLPEQQENEAGKGVPLVNDSFVRLPRRPHWSWSGRYAIKNTHTGRSARRMHLGFITEYRG